MVATTKPNENRAKNEDQAFVKAGKDFNSKNIGFVRKNKLNDFYDDSDEDYPKNEIRNNKVSGQAKTKVPPDTPIDKYEAMMRLEREKKAMQKKMLDEEYSKHKSPMKQKKTSKTNWTKYYETGLLDEDDYIV